MSYQTSFSDLGFGFFGAFFNESWVFIYLGIFLFYSFCQYTLSKKLNIENSWIAWVPIISYFNLLQIAGVSFWWIIGLFIPFVNIFVYIILMILTGLGISSRTGHGGWWTAGLILLFPIMFPITALTYQPKKHQNTSGIGMQNNKQTTDQDDEVANVLDQGLRSFDISGINCIRFHEKDGKSFQISLDSIKRIACFIKEKTGKTTFAPGELTEEKDFLLKNYRSKLSENDFQMLLTHLSSWVEKGGSFEIVKNG